MFKHNHEWAKPLGRVGITAYNGRRCAMMAPRHERHIVYRQLTGESVNSHNDTQHNARQ